MLKQLLDLLGKLDDDSADLLITFIEESESNKDRADKAEDQLLKSCSFYYQGRDSGSERLTSTKLK